MKIRRARNLFVRTDASGDIVSVFWPYDPPIDETAVEQESGPSQTGVALSDGEEMHVVAVPDELYSAELTADFFSTYEIQVHEQGEAALVRRSTEAGQ